MKSSLVAISATLLLSLGVTQASAQSVPDVEAGVVSVKDLARSEQIYTSILRFKEVQHGEGVSPELRRLWNLPPDVTMKWAVLAKPEVPDSIKVRMVEFTPSSPRIRYEYRWQDPGLNDFHICPDDTITTYKALIASGFTAHSEPQLWAGGGGERGYGTRQWHEVFMHGLDGEGITFMDAGIPTSDLQFAATRCIQSPGSPVSAIRDITVTVNKQQEGYVFMHDLMGWRDTGRWEAFGPEMEKMLGAPLGVVARPIFFRIPGKEKEKPGIIMVETAGVANLDLSERSGPPNRGFAVLSFKTDQLDTLYQKMVAGDVRVVFPPASIPDPPYDGARAFCVRGPGGSFVEVIERKPQ